MYLHSNLCYIILLYGCLVIVCLLNFWLRRNVLHFPLSCIINEWRSQTIKDKTSSKTSVGWLKRTLDTCIARLQNGLWNHEICGIPNYCITFSTNVFVFNFRIAPKIIFLYQILCRLHYYLLNVQKLKILSPIFRTGRSLFSTLGIQLQSFSNWNFLFF